jgi:glycosyltransferase involved in cell wall biosynthesis
VKLEDKLRIVLVSIHYPPLRTSAAVQMRDLAVEMTKQGHEVSVIIPAEDLGIPWKLETMDGVRVLSLNTPCTRDLGYFRRTIGELSLSFMMLHRLRSSPLGKVRWDLAAWYSPTIFFGLLIWFLKYSTGCRTYLILRDIFPEWAVDLGLIRNRVIYTFFKAIAWIQYAVADVIGVQTPSNLGYLKQWSKRKAKRVEVLYNWQTPSPNVGSSIDIKTTHLAGRKILVFIGNMGIAQGMDILIDLAREMDHRPDIGFIFVGRGSEVSRLKATVITRSLRNTMFFDEVDSKEMPGLLAQCFIGLVTLDPRHRTHNIPGKFLTYLLAGLPVLARVNPGTDLAQLINNEGVGRAYNCEAAHPLREFIEYIIDQPRLYAKMSSNGLALAARMFSADQVVRQITRIAFRDTLHASPNGHSRSDL